MSGLAIPIGMIIQPGINGYTPELDTRLPFDPDAAKRLLAAAGYPDGFAVTLDCPNDRYINDEAICRAAAAMLGGIGIRVSVAARPMREHFPRIRNKETDFYMLGWGTTTSDSLYPLSYLIRSDAPYNGANYINPNIDGLIDAIGTTMIAYARDPKIEEVWRTVRDDIVLVPLHQQVIVWAMHDRLELPVDPWNLPRFRLARLKERESRSCEQLWVGSVNFRAHGRAQMPPPLALPRLMLQAWSSCARASRSYARTGRTRTVGTWLPPHLECPTT